MSNPLYEAAYGTLATPAAIAAARAIRPHSAPPQPQDPAYEEPTPQGARSLASPRAIAAYNAMRGIPQGTPTSQVPQTAMEAATTPGANPLTPESPQQTWGQWAGEKSINAVAGAANILDLPGSIGRDLLTLAPGGPAPRNPFDQILDPTGKRAHENRIEGRQILRDYGMVSRKKDTWPNFWAGLGLEVAADPLTYLAMPLSALTKAGNVFSKMGVKSMRPLAREIAELSNKSPTWIGGQFAKAALTGNTIVKHSEKYFNDRVVKRVGQFTEGKQFKGNESGGSFKDLDELNALTGEDGLWAIVDDGNGASVYKWSSTPVGEKEPFIKRWVNTKDYTQEEVDQYARKVADDIASGKKTSEVDTAFYKENKDAIEKILKDKVDNPAGSTTQKATEEATQSSGGKWVLDKEGTRAASTAIDASVLKMTPRGVKNTFEGIYKHLYGKDIPEDKLLELMSKDLDSPLRTLTSIGMPFAKPWKEITLKNPEERFKNWIERQPSAPSPKAPQGPPPAGFSARTARNPLSPDAKKARKASAEARGIKAAQSAQGKINPEQAKQALREAGYADVEIADSADALTKLGRLGLVNSDGTLRVSDIGPNATRVLRQSSKAFDSAEVAENFPIVEALVKSWAAATGKNADEYFQSLVVKSNDLANEEALGKYEMLKTGGRLITAASENTDDAVETFFHEIAHDIEQMFKDTPLWKEIEDAVSQKLGNERMYTDDGKNEWTERASEALADSLAGIASGKIAKEQNATALTKVRDVIRSVFEAFKRIAGKDKTPDKLENFFNKILNGDVPKDKTKKLKNTASAFSKTEIKNESTEEGFSKTISNANVGDDERFVSEMRTIISSRQGYDAQDILFEKTVNKDGTSNWRFYTKSGAKKKEASKKPSNSFNHGPKLIGFQNAIRQRFAGNKEIENVEDVVDQYTQVLEALAKADGKTADEYLDSVNFHTPDDEGMIKGDGLLQEDPVLAKIKEEFSETEKRIGGREAYESAKASNATNLNYRQWVEVRTPAFKNWFGDWENDAANASKVVDPKTGEPLVVYHGTPGTKEFTEFNITRRGLYGPLTYLTSSSKEGSLYAGEGGRVIPVFVSIKNPLPVSHSGDELTGLTASRNIIDGIRAAKDSGHDGIIVTRTYSPLVEADEGIQRFWPLPFEPTQIKSATANRGTFDRSNPNILLQDKNKNIRGEYWLQDGYAQFADGDIGDFNHEAIAGLAAMGRIADEFGVDFDEMGGWDGLRELIREEILDSLDESEESLRIIERIDDGDIDDVISEYIAKNTSEDLDKISETLKVAMGYGDSREWAAKELGWVRMQGNNLESWGLDKSKLQSIARSLPDEVDDMSSELFDIYDYKTKSFYQDVPYEIMERGDMRSLREYGNRLYQKTGKSGSRQAPLGAIVFDDLNKVVNIFFGPKANVSTIAHEIAHLARRRLRPEILKQAEEYYGVTGGKWTIKQEEAFAKDFEAYLSRGIAPTKELKSVFEKMKQWFANVYKNITNSPKGAELRAENIAIFDQMFGAPYSKIEKKANTVTLTSWRNNINSVPQRISTASEDLVNLANSSKDNIPTLEKIGSNPLVEMTREKARKQLEIESEISIPGYTKDQAQDELIRIYDSLTNILGDDQAEVALASTKLIKRFVEAGMKPGVLKTIFDSMSQEEAAGIAVDMILNQNLATDQLLQIAYHGASKKWEPEKLIKLKDGTEQYIKASDDMPDGSEVAKEFPEGRFNLDYVSTGEGRGVEGAGQAYGFGAYFADAESLARYYRKTVAGDGSLVLIDGKSPDSFLIKTNLRPHEEKAITSILRYGDLRNAKIFLEHTSADTVFDKFQRRWSHFPTENKYISTSGRHITIAPGTAASILRQQDVPKDVLDKLKSKPSYEENSTYVSVISIDGIDVEKYGDDMESLYINAYNTLNSSNSVGFRKWADDTLRDIESAKKQLAFLEDLEKSGRIKVAKPGAIYKVNLPEDYSLMYWEKPFSQQHPKVQRALNKIVKNKGSQWEQAIDSMATRQDGAIVRKLDSKWRQMWTKDFSEVWKMGDQIEAVEATVRRIPDGPNTGKYEATIESFFDIEEQLFDNLDDAKEWAGKNGGGWVAFTKTNVDEPPIGIVFDDAKEAKEYLDKYHPADLTGENIYEQLMDEARIESRKRVANEIQNEIQPEIDALKEEIRGIMNQGKSLKEAEEALEAAEKELHSFGISPNGLGRRSDFNGLREWKDAKDEAYQKWMDAITTVNDQKIGRISSEAADKAIEILDNIVLSTGTKVRASEEISRTLEKARIREFNSGKWISRSDGTIIFTNNEGQTWKAAVTPAAKNYYHVSVNDTYGKTVYHSIEISEEKAKQIAIKELNNKDNYHFEDLMATAKKIDSIEDKISKSSISTFQAKKAASKKLASVGIVGNKVPANHSSGGNSKGRYNFVIFDDRFIEVLESLPQLDGTSIKGLTTFGDAGSAIVQIVKGKGDASTAVHEIVHVMRKNLSDDLQSEATAAMKVQFKNKNTIENILGKKIDQDIKVVGENGKWTRDAEEVFARLFERWLYDGRGPKDLIEIFEKLSKAIRAVYLQIKGSPIDSEISDELRTVFEKMLKSNVKTAPPATLDPRRKFGIGLSNFRKKSAEDISTKPSTTAAQTDGLADTIRTSPDIADTQKPSISQAKSGQSDISGQKINTDTAASSNQAKSISEILGQSTAIRSIDDLNEESQRVVQSLRGHFNSLETSDFKEVIQLAESAIRQINPNISDTDVAAATQWLMNSDDAIRRRIGELQSKTDISQFDISEAELQRMSDRHFATEAQAVLKSTIPGFKKKQNLKEIEELSNNAMNFIFKGIKSLGITDKPINLSIEEIIYATGADEMSAKVIQRVLASNKKTETFSKLILRKISPPKPSAAKKKVFGGKVVKVATKEEALSMIENGGKQELFESVNTLKRLMDEAEKAGNPEEVADILKHITTAKSKIVESMQDQISDAVRGVPEARRDEAQQEIAVGLMENLIDSHDFMKNGKFVEITKSKMLGHARNKIRQSNTKNAQKGGEFTPDHGDLKFMKNINPYEIQKYNDLIDAVESGKTVNSHIESLDAHSKKTLRNIIVKIKEARKKDSNRAMSRKPIEAMGDVDSKEMSEKMLQDSVDSGPGKSRLDKIASTPEEIEDTLLERTVSEVEDVLDTPGFYENLQSNQKKVVDALFEKNENGLWVRKRYGEAPELSPEDFAKSKYHKKSVLEKAAKQLGGTWNKASLRSAIDNIASSQASVVHYKKIPKQQAANASKLHFIARPAWNEIFEHIKGEAIGDRILQALDAGENLFLSNPATVAFTRLFDKSVYNMGDYNGQELARRRYEAAEKGIFAQRRQLFLISNYLGKNKFFDPKETASELIKAGTERKEALSAAKKLINDRNNDVTRFMESLDSSHKLSRTLFKTEKQAQEMENFLASLREAFPDFLNKEQMSGLMSRNLFDKFIKFFPRNKTEPNRFLKTTPEGQSLMSAQMDSQVGRDLILKDIPDGTAILNELSVDPKLSGIGHDEKLLNDGLNDVAMSNAIKHIKDTYGFEKIIDPRLIGKDGELKPKGKQKLEKIINWISMLDKAHVDEQVPIFGHNFLRDFANYAEQHYTKVAIGLTVQDLAARSIVYDGGQANKLTDLFAGTALDSHNAYLNVIKMTDNYANYMEWQNSTIMKLANPGGKKKPKITINKDGSVTIAGQKKKSRNAPKGANYANIEELLNAWNFGRAYANKTKMSVPKEVFDSATHFLRAWTTQPALTGMAQMAGAALNTFKGLVTLPFLSFHARNFMSGQMQNYFYGAWDPTAIGPDMYLKPMRQALTMSNGNVIAGVSKEIPRYIIDQESIIPASLIGTESGDKFVTEWLRSQVFSHGLTGDKQGYAAEKIGDAVSTIISQNPGATIRNRQNWFGLKPAILDPTTSLKQKLNPIGIGSSMYPTMEKLPNHGRHSLQMRRMDDTTFTPGAVGEELSLLIENVNRISPFLSFIKQGFTADEAARKVQMIQFDYSNISDFERKYMKQLVPFYTFTSKALKLTLGDLVTNPGGKQAWSIRLANRLQNPDEPMPEHIRRGIAIPLPSGPTGEARYLSGFGLAWEDPIELTSFLYGDTQATAAASFSKLRPEIQGAAELAFGKSAFFGRELEDMDPQLGRLRDNVTGNSSKGLSEPLLGSQSLELFASKMPSSRAVSLVNSAFDDRKSAVDKLLGMSSGIKVNTVNEEARNRILMNRYNDIMKDIGAREMAVTYVPEWMRERLSEEKLQEINQLQRMVKELKDKNKEQKKKAELNALRSAASGPSE